MIGVGSCKGLKIKTGHGKSLYGTSMNRVRFFGFRKEFRGALQTL